MRAVWSFWSKPYFAGTGFRWGSEFHHLLAWGLSVRLASAHHLETALVTDKAGKDLLVDGLGLRFTSVSTDLERLRDADARLWVLGKLVAYSLQDVPFVHLDTDVFLWSALPAWLTSASVFGQQPEKHLTPEALPDPSQIETSFKLHSCDLPLEWQYARSRWGRRQFYEINCGIVGGVRHDFLRYFARLGLDFALGSRNAAAWAAVPNIGVYNTILEQFFLAACVEYHRSNPRSPYRGITARYLFRSWEDAFGASPARVGFTHLLADSKRNSQILERLESRLKVVDFEVHQRCRRLCDRVLLSDARRGPI